MHQQRTRKRAMTIRLGIAALTLLALTLGSCADVFGPSNDGGNAGTEDTFAVTYNPNGADSGSVPSDEGQYATGDEVTVMGNPNGLSRSGYTFKGWSKSANGGTLVYTEGDTFLMESAPVTLYAQWTALPTYTVTYDANDADSGSAPGDQTKIEGSDLTLADNTGGLTRSGYTFVGWNTAANGSGTSYAEGATYSTDEELTLYADWTTLPTYTVTYDANDADSGSAPGDQTKTQGIDLTLADNTGGLTRSGVTFVGWNTADDGSGTSYAEGDTYSTDENLTLYAEWTAPSTYTVTYDANGADSGSAPSDQTTTAGSDLTLADNSGNLQQSGVIFVGWNTADDGSGTSYAEGATYYSTDANLTLYAEWKIPSTYTVTYDANGAFIGSPPDDQTKTEGDDLTIADKPDGLTRSGYIFAGWNARDDGAGRDYDAGDTYSTDADLTLYAEWIRGYTVTYDANGANSGSAPTDQTKTHGTVLTLAENSGALDIDGYQAFAGWNTEPDGSGTSYAPGATYSDDADLMLYAEWSAIGETGEAGGIIFYDDEADGTDDIAGARYLEAAPASTEWDNIEWGDDGTEIGGDAQLTGIGDGQAATDAIVAHMEGKEITETAAQRADGLSHGGYDDWFLPSKNELDLMYFNKRDIEDFTSSNYWSSSEGNDALAWYQDFGFGSQGFGGKVTSKFRVRAVRAF